MSSVGVRGAIDDVGFLEPGVSEVCVSSGLVFKLSSSQASPGEFNKC